MIHHAICNLLEPVFERFTISDSYACRKGKGTHRAMRRAQQFSQSYAYCLKLDVRKFFESVNHQRLEELLERKFRERRLLELLTRIIDQPIPHGIPGKGLPIGNLTSQHFANFYLSHLDHFVKDELGVKGYLRYMDDMLVFGDGKEELHRLHVQIRDFLQGDLRLELKEEAVVLAPVTQGIPFLGFRIFSRMIRLQPENWTRFKRKVREREQAYREGRLDDFELVQSVQSMLGHVQQANTLRLRKNFFQARQSVEG